MPAVSLIDGGLLLAQRGEVICLRSHSRCVGKLGYEPVSGVEFSLVQVGWSLDLFSSSVLQDPSGPKMESLPYST